MNIAIELARFFSLLRCGKHILLNRICTDVASNEWMMLSRTIIITAFLTVSGGKKINMHL